MLIQQVIHDEPLSPRKLNSRIPRDLETICLKCLEKDPSQRYDSAQQLSEELRRYLQGEADSGASHCSTRARMALVQAESTGHDGLELAPAAGHWRAHRCDAGGIISCFR